MTTGTRFLTREETEAELRDLNDQAKAMSRRGAGAQSTPEYAALHMRINRLLADLRAERD
jgi:ElaB/YqjD/DUF883 family membrane-anchored ribosome-binding protein